MKKIPIKFIATSETALNVVEKPYPAAKKLPDWYKNMPHYISGVKGVNEFGEPNGTIRKCMPLLDSITAGYHIPLHSDLWVETKQQDQPIFKSTRVVENFISTHDVNQYYTYPFSSDFYPQAFKFTHEWIVSTPKGWSCMFTHPNYYDDLPFRSLTSIVDTDQFPAVVSIIFFLKRNFKGLIPKGTPITQVIPFKREKFVAEYSYDKGSYINKWYKAATSFFDVYKNNFRQPKEFEIEEIKKSKCPFGFLHKKH
jgi:hypothetical protein